MNEITLAMLPDGALFQHVTVSVIQIGPEHVPDLDPHLLDRALTRLQVAMRSRLRATVDELRGRLDYPRAWSRRELRVPSLRSRPSDMSMAAALISSESPFGLLYEWPPGVASCWPDGFALVLWRGRLYTLGEDARLTPWREGR